MLLKLTTAEKAELLQLLNAAIVAYAQNVGVSPRSSNMGEAWRAYSTRVCALCNTYGVNHNDMPKLFPTIRVGPSKTLVMMDYQELRKLVEVGLYIEMKL